MDLHKLTSLQSGIWHLLGFKFVCSALIPERFVRILINLAKIFNRQNFPIGSLIPQRDTKIFGVPMNAAPQWDIRSTGSILYFIDFIVLYNLILFCFFFQWPSIK